MNPFKHIEFWYHIGIIGLVTLGIMIVILGIIEG